MSNRKDILLRAAYDLLKTAIDSRIVLEAGSILTRYDKSDCDGVCLMTDIAIEIGIEDGTEPIPTEEKQ